MLHKASALSIICCKNEKTFKEEESIEIFKNPVPKIWLIKREVKNLD